MKLVVLSGGTGTPKLIEGLRRILDDKEITVIVNVADNFWWNGLYVAPDVDTVLYLFANLLDTEKYWGIIGDTFNFLQQAKVYGIEMDWFNIGDKDLAVHLVRTMLLKKGYTLTQVTKYLAKRLDISAHILPATDDHIETYVLTNLGNLHIQEFLVKYRFQPEVYGITFPGLDKAKATEDVIEELKGADAILIGPSNPINSITPIIKVKGIDELLMKLRKRIPIVAVSPLISGRPVSGPADKFMKALGYEPTSYGVAKIYQGYIDAIVIDERDHFLKDRIEKELKVKVAMCDTLMKDLDSKVRLARVVIELIEAIESEGSHQV